jgi:hypothetical protein
MIQNRKSASLRRTSAIGYLLRMPASTRWNSYYGHSLQGKRRFLYDPKNNIAGYLREAVSRIAFGGLVPMATKPLIDAVQFLVDDESEFKDKNEIKLFEVLDTLNNQVDSATQKWLGDLEINVYIVNSNTRINLESLVIKTTN